MAYKVIILYRLYMPSYFLGTFTEYPYNRQGRTYRHASGGAGHHGCGNGCDAEG